MNTTASPIHSILSPLFIFFRLGSLLNISPVNCLWNVGRTILIEYKMKKKRKKRVRDRKGLMGTLLFILGEIRQFKLLSRGGLCFSVRMVSGRLPLRIGLLRLPTHHSFCSYTSVLPTSQGQHSRETHMKSVAPLLPQTAYSAQNQSTSISPHPQ